MSVQFINPADLAAVPCPTAAIGTISFATDAPSLVVSLSEDGDTFYSVRLYAFEGTVSARDFRSVIELRMRSREQYISYITVRATDPDDPEDTAVMLLSCLYCEYVMPAGFSTDKAFLSCLRTQRVAPDTSLSLYSTAGDGAPVSILASGFNGSGEPDAVYFSSEISQGAVSLDFAQILADAADEGLQQVIAVSVKCGRREKSFFISRWPAFSTFAFRNCFFCTETVDIPGINTLNPEVDSSSAVVGGAISIYDLSRSRSYEFESAPLARHEAAALVQLIESRSIAIKIGDEFVPVVITKHSTKVSSDDADISSLKLTWRFADTRPRLFADDADPLLYPSRIFTSPFQQEFM